MTKTLVATPDPEGNKDDFDQWFKELEIDPALPEFNKVLEQLEKDLDEDADDSNA